MPVKEQPVSKEMVGKEGYSLAGVKSSSNFYREYRLLGPSLHT
jgi:hypothetical protein